MNQTTTTAPKLPELWNIGDLTIYTKKRAIYSHDANELFYIQDLTTDDLTRLHDELTDELGEETASAIMQELTANK